MKKIIFGILLTIIGLTFSAFILLSTATVYEHWDDYYGKTGLAANLSYNHLTGPLIISLCVMIGGLIIVFYEAYIRKEQ